MQDEDQRRTQEKEAVKEMMRVIEWIGEVKTGEKGETSENVCVGVDMKIKGRTMDIHGGRRGHMRDLSPSPPSELDFLRGKWLNAASLSKLHPDPHADI